MSSPITVHFAGTPTVVNNNIAELNFSYNIPHMIANIPCKITPHSLYTSSTGNWILYIDGITQPRTTELNATGQNPVSTRVAIVPANSDTPPFYGVLNSGTQRFTFTYRAIKAPSPSETSFNMTASLTFEPLR